MDVTFIVLQARFCTFQSWLCARKVHVPVQWPSFLCEQSRYDLQRILRPRRILCEEKDIKGASDLHETTCEQAPLY